MGLPAERQSLILLELVSHFPAKLKPRDFKAIT
jgi:hypothetical protein